MAYWYADDFASKIDGLGHFRSPFTRRSNGSPRPTGWMQASVVVTTRIERRSSVAFSSSAAISCGNSKYLEWRRLSTIPWSWPRNWACQPLTSGPITNLTALLPRNAQCAGLGQRHQAQRLTYRRGGGEACRFLIEKVGFQPDTQIAYIDFDIEKALYLHTCFLMCSLVISPEWQSRLSTSSSSRPAFCHGFSSSKFATALSCRRCDAALEPA